MKRTQWQLTRRIFLLHPVLCSFVTLKLPDNRALYALSCYAPCVNLTARVSGWSRIATTQACIYTYLQVNAKCVILLNIIWSVCNMWSADIQDGKTVGKDLWKRSLEWNREEWWMVKVVMKEMMNWCVCMTCMYARWDECDVDRSSTGWQSSSLGSSFHRQGEP